MNKYKGFRVNPDSEIKRIDLKTIKDTASFFKEFIAGRQPVVIRGIFTNEKFNPSMGSIEHLIEKAGDEVVKVEPRGTAGTYGTSIKRVKMPFKNFLERVQKGDEDLYLTTQYKDEDEEESEELAFVEEYLDGLVPNPLSPLIGDFPLRPSILGNLIPQQYNLWLGNSKNGSSSGLHHDFHDNLYVLLKGKKRFTLFAPSDAENLYLHGKIADIYPNGLISYEGRETRADGATEYAVAEHKMRCAEQRLEELLDSNAPQKDILAAENELNELIDQVLALDGEEADDSEIAELEQKLKEDKEASDGSEQKSDDESDNSVNFGEGEEDSLEAALDAAEMEEGDFVDDFDVMDEEEQLPSEPPSFSRINVKSLHSSKIPKEFPLLAKAKRLTVELNEGEMLYLPASWFHEVTSISAPDSSYHCAFNYWLAPPTTSKFSKPYEDNFWEDQWNSIEFVLTKMQEDCWAGKNPSQIAPEEAPASKKEKGGKGNEAKGKEAKGKEAKGKVVKEGQKEKGNKIKEAKKADQKKGGNTQFKPKGETKSQKEFSPSIHKKNEKINSKKPNKGGDKSFPPKPAQNSNKLKRGGDLKEAPNKKKMRNE